MLNFGILRTWVAVALVLAGGALRTFAGDPAGFDADSIRLAADSAITGIWIDGAAVKLQAHAKDWTQADEYGPRTGLRCIAVSAQGDRNALGHAGFIGAVVLADGRRVGTDSTWRAWHGTGEPPADAKGRPWTAPDYDDSAWNPATEIGVYGTPPWGTDKESGDAEGDTVPGKDLDGAMRLGAPAPSITAAKSNFSAGATLPAGTDITALFDFTSGAPVQRWNATWIWASPPLGGAEKACFRKTFAGGAGIPPSVPQYPHLTAVTPTAFTLAWEPSFSAQGPVTYELGWNGQVMAKTSATGGTVDGITINPVPQNYAWVRAVAPDGTRSRPSQFILIATPSTAVPEAPEHLRVTGRSAHGLSLAWDPARDAGRLDCYQVMLNKILCVVPPGVCSVSVNFEKMIAPGSPVKVEVRAQDISGKTGPSATVEDSSAARNPVDLAAPVGLTVKGGVLSWKPVPAAKGYRLWRDGVAVPGRIDQTSAPVPKGEANGFVQVSAVDDLGDTSPRSLPTVLGKPAKPAGPVAADGGRSGDMIVLRWSRPPAGTCAGYRIDEELGANWTPVAKIDDPWQDELVIGQTEEFHTGSNDTLPSRTGSPGTALQPGKTYGFRVVALGADNTANFGPSVHITTVAPPAESALLRFAVIVATDGRFDFLDRSLSDADARACTFALVKGQIVPQGTVTTVNGQRVTRRPGPDQWDAVLAVTNRHQTPSILSLLGSKDLWDGVEDYCSSWPMTDGVPILGRYDLAPWRTGQPLDQLHLEARGALRLAGLLENARSNPDFLPDLERWLQEAEADPACRWFFTSGVSTENAPKGVPRVMLELGPPEIDFMRMINGDRGHELELDPGSNVACACPQRNRVGAHYLVSVEQKRIVLESRQWDAKKEEFVTDGLQEIAYDRAANFIAASNLRVPHPLGIAMGHARHADNTPPWTQNRIVACPANGEAPVRLLGHSARAVPLTFTVTRQPAHGTLSGSGSDLTYRPEKDFKGEDLFLYRADDGGTWPGNTAWVRVAVGKER